MSRGSGPSAPLAERMRPHTLDEVAGQAHLLGPGQPLRVAFDAGVPHSMILWGPPGVGKTTLARLMAQAFDCAFIALSAVLAGVKEIRAARDDAERLLQASGRRTLLFVDEIHRFNRSQQDGLLPYVESGLLVFVGATTENPAFEVNSALLSRAQVYVLRPLEDADLRQLFARARTKVCPAVDFDDDAIAELVTRADGDARRLLNALEQVLVACAGALHVTGRQVTQALAPGLRRFDKSG
ncbi:MAG TPA: AAA family ATPase, partial [Acidiferrobacteraceae bacterium]|nr:AAA family ATPase [Acidiferrobacteraceae bacterium]